LFKKRFPKKIKWHFLPFSYPIFFAKLFIFELQTPGLMMDLNEGMFAANGGCGYALKPSIMIDSGLPSNFDSAKEAGTAMSRSNPEVTTLHLRIISGTDLPKVVL
jgi:hypothetical protein